MSSGLSVSDGDDGHQDGDDDGRYQQGIQQKLDGAVTLPTPETDDKDNSEQPSKEGLNPWSIAKIVSGNRRASAQPDRRVQETHQETQFQFREYGPTPDFGGGSQSHRQESLPEAMMEYARQQPYPQPSRRSALENPASHGRRLEELFGEAPRKAPRSQIRKPNQYGQSRGNLGLQSPPTSSPHEQAYGGGRTKERRLPRQVKESGHLVQSQIPFDRNHGGQQRRKQIASLDLGQQFGGFSRPACRPEAQASARQPAVEEANFMTRGDVAVSPDGQGTIPQTSSPCQLHPDGVVGASEIPTEAPPRRELDDGTAQTLLADDPRTRLIKQQRLIAQNSQKKPRRLKTEQLPLETIPRNFQTCALLLTLATGGFPLSQWFSNASQFDSWLVDGKLDGAFKEGIGAEERALLVEPLLTRIGGGRSLAA